MNTLGLVALACLAGLALVAVVVLGMLIGPILDRKTEEEQGEQK